MSKVIARLAILLILILPILCANLAAQTALEKKVDSLFMIASSGDIKYQSLVKPAIESLAVLKADAVPRLTEKFDTKSARERQTLSEIFKKIGPVAVPHLLTALKFDNGLVVERVCGVLGEIGDTSATVGLLAVADRPRWQIREQTIGSLGKIRDHRGDSAVVAALTDTIPLVRKSAAVSCGQMKIQASLLQLVHQLGDSYYGARMSAADALCKLDTAAVVTAICDSLPSDNHLLGNLGCEILGRLATEPALNTLAHEAFMGTVERRAHAAVALTKADPHNERNFCYFYLAFETDRLNRLKVESVIESQRHVELQSK